MSEMIKRVADKLRETHAQWHHNLTGDRGGRLTMGLDFELAKAALRAIREPTDAMVSAGRINGLDDGGVSGRWRAMVDSALDEKQ